MTATANLHLLTTLPTDNMSKLSAADKAIAIYLQSPTIHFIGTAGDYFIFSHSFAFDIYLWSRVDGDWVESVQMEDSRFELVELDDADSVLEVAFIRDLDGIIADMDLVQ